MSTISPLTDTMADNSTLDHSTGESTARDEIAGTMITGDEITGDEIPGDITSGDEMPVDKIAGEVIAGEMIAAELISTDSPVEASAEPSPDLPNIFATKNLPRSVAFARCPTIAEALVRYDVVDPILHARLREARISPALQLRCSDFPDPLMLLAVVDFDMPDVVGVLPIWQQLAHASPRAELRVIGYDEMALLERMLNGDSPLDLETLDLPTLLLLDEEFLVQGQWGPRPQAAERYIEEWLADHADFERFAEDESAEGIAAFAALNLDLVRYMRVWYNSTLDKACSVELERLLASMQGEGGEGEAAVMARATIDADPGDESDSGND